MGAWSETSGYPGIVYFFEQRLGFAGTIEQPQTFWLSQSADFENMTPDNRDDANDGTVEDDDAIDYTISADQVNVIRWMLAYQGDLLIGTAGGEWDRQVIRPGADAHRHRREAPDGLRIVQKRPCPDAGALDVPPKGAAQDP